MPETRPLPTPAEVDQIEARAKAALAYEKSEWSAEEGSYVSPATRPDSQEEMDCPLCNGDGYVEGQRYDSKETLAATVVAYGIGKGLALAEAWVENAPSDILRLVEAVRVLRNENIVLAGAIQTANKVFLRERAEKFCYQCDKPVKYLFSDGRCSKCTREGSEK